MLIEHPSQKSCSYSSYLNLNQGKCAQKQQTERNCSMLGKIKLLPVVLVGTGCLGIGIDNLEALPQEACQKAMKRCLDDKDCYRWFDLIIVKKGVGYPLREACEYTAGTPEEKCKAGFDKCLTM